MRQLLILLTFGNYAYGVVLANITPISSAMSLRAEANAGNGLIVNTQAVSQTTTLNPLSVMTFAQAFNGAANCMAQTSGSATWTSAAAGTFSIATTFISTAGLSAYPSSKVATGSPGWFYTFTSEVPATMTLQYSIDHRGSFAFGNVLAINESIDGSFARQDGFQGLPLSGSLTYAISPNVTYGFQLFDNSNLNGLPAFISGMNATFAFEITSIPEPSTLALVCGGLLALGFWRVKR